MSASQAGIDPSTPMGANLVPGGATVRVWAPGARHLYVAWGGAASWQPGPQDELVKNPAANDHWTGFFPNVADGDKYRFFVVGEQGSGFKRDPWARELELYGYPDCDCLVRDLNAYPWHDQEFRPPQFSDLVVYQFHVGVFYARDAQGRDHRPYHVAKLLDVLDRVEYLADLGVNALQPLPLDEFQGKWSLGYNHTDLFSPEMDYCVDPNALGPYLEKVNRLLQQKRKPPLTLAQLGNPVRQLQAFVDVCHLYGLAVLCDLVYNHAGGGFDAQSIDHFDFPANPSHSNSLYFSPDGWAGGRIFRYWEPEVRSFLIENAKMWLRDYHVDGLRFDEVSAIDSHGGWFFCQEMTGALRAMKPREPLIAEYWGTERWLSVWQPPEGMGFDVGYADGIRDGVRSVIAEAAGGAFADVHMGRLKPALQRPWNFPSAWQAYNCIENHDFVLDMDGDHRKPRIPKLADWNDPRSWYARSRSRAAMGLLLTAPGIPMLFMGQEFLEDKLWSDNPEETDCFIWWDGLKQDRHMRDFLTFTKELIAVRRRQPALRSEPINVFHVNEPDRILAFHRWVPGAGRDVVVVVSLREATFHGGYALGFPLPGQWLEIFNSDVFDHYPNPWAHGNDGAVEANGAPMHGLPASARLTLPANGVLVFARDWGTPL